MKKLILISAMVMLSIITYAQKPIITFETETHDFGEIQEADGVVSFDFDFTNTGKTPLVLHNVQASCGCTTPEWVKTPIQPKATGKIKVTFNPSNRPGTFSKTITVQSNAESPVKTLRITGNVLKKPKTIEDSYPINFDGLRLSESHMAFTKMGPNETKITEIEVINTSDKDITPQFINVPSHIKVAAIPETLKPNEKGVIQANYNAAVKNDWGFISDYMYVIFNDVSKYTNRITVSASIEEDFSSLTEAELAQAPQIAVDAMTFDFGEIPQNQKVSHDFIITNNGKNNLIIRKVKSSCGCTAVSPEKNTIAQNESTNVKVTFDSHGKSGRQQKTITVITNDPKTPTIILRIMCTVTTANVSNLK